MVVDICELPAPILPSGAPARSSATPRQPRRLLTGAAHHIVTRGNERRRLFFAPADYERFLCLMASAKERYAVKVLGVTLMPNHVHAILQQEADGAVSDYLHWVLGSFALSLRARTGTVGHGHVFQSRFWSDPLLEQLRFLTALRYVEANPVRAELVRHAGEWRWCSLALRQQRSRLLDPLPIELPARWDELVNRQQPESELREIRQPRQTQTPAALRAEGR
jgi:putative transposase